MRDNQPEIYHTNNVEGETGIFKLVLLILTGETKIETLLSDPKIPESIKLRLEEEIHGEEAAQRRRVQNFINSLSNEDLEILEDIVDRNNSQK